MKQQNWIFVSAVAALLAAAPGAFAQDTSTSDNTANSTPAMSSGSTSGNMGMSSGTIDYSVLSNPFYDYMDLQQARARGYSDNEIAAIAKIAHMTGMSFSSISQQVQAGHTFAMLADKYNLRMQDVMDTTDEQARIANYRSAYENTGDMAMKNNMANTQVMGYSATMSNGAMSNGMNGSATGTGTMNNGTMNNGTTTTPPTGVETTPGTTDTTPNTTNTAPGTNGAVGAPATGTTGVPGSTALGQ